MFLASQPLPKKASKFQPLAVEPDGLNLYGASLSDHLFIRVCPESKPPTPPTQTWAGKKKTSRAITAQSLQVRSEARKTFKKGQSNNDVYMHVYTNLNTVYTHLLGNCNELLIYCPIMSFQSTHR